MKSAVRLIKNRYKIREDLIEKKTCCHFLNCTVGVGFKIFHFKCRTFKTLDPRREYRLGSSNPHQHINIKDLFPIAAKCAQRVDYSSILQNIMMRKRSASLLSGLYTFVWHSRERHSPDVGQQNWPDR